MADDSPTTTPSLYTCTVQRQFSIVATRVKLALLGNVPRTTINNDGSGGRHQPIQKLALGGGAWPVIGED